mgnify:CR=1 FL=1
MLVDTNIIIDHLRGEKQATAFLRKIEEGMIKGYISTITEAEVLSGSKLTQKKIEEILMLFEMFEKLEVNSAIAQKAGDFRHKYKCGIMDAIIAASADYKGIELVTRNIKHFKIISEIKLFNID